MSNVSERPADQTPESGPSGSDDSSRRSMVVTFVPRNVWRVGWVAIALVAITLLLRFVVDDGGGVIFTVLMGWFAAIAMAPAVDRMAKHMRRGVATIIVMVSVFLFLTLFFIAFGRLFFDQIVQLLEGLPGFVDSAIIAINERFETTYSTDSILQQLNLTPEQATSYASEFAGGIFGFLISVIGGLFGVFTFFLFAFYLSADGPRFRLWLASLFPTRLQDVVVNIWDVTAEKTGSYVAARVILATLNGTSTAIVFLIIGMPSWLALGIWTGLVAQFVPTIGTYLAITLPVIVGLLSGNPWVGVLALAWAVLYQQVENLTFEPRISARAVNVHPAVAFGSVLLGASLFGVAGALLAIPVAAMFLALLNIYRKRYDFSEKLVAERVELPNPAIAVGSPQRDELTDKARDT
jgi:predicted PurR-regulated permease PerM